MVVENSCSGAIGVDMAATLRNGRRNYAKYQRMFCVSTKGVPGAYVSRRHLAAGG